MLVIERKIIDFIQNDLGIKIHHIEVIKRNESFYCAEDETGVRKVPYLLLMVYESSYDEVICENKNNGLAKKEIADKIIDFIGNLDTNTFDKYECYDSKMYINVHSWDRYCYCDFAYNQKDIVQNCVFKIVPISPKSIYAWSNPGLNIVYSTDDYKKCSIDSFEDKLKTEVSVLADNFVQKKYGAGLAKDVFEVKIWNPDMKGYNGYGLARED